MRAQKRITDESGCSLANCPNRLLKKSVTTTLVPKEADFSVSLIELRNRDRGWDRSSRRERLPKIVFQRPLMR